MDHHHSYATRIRHNITIKPAARRRNSTDAQLTHPPTPDQYPEFPPPHVVLHPDDANSKVFLAVARAFISVDNRAMTIKDIADRASRFGLVCQNLSAGAQAVTTYLRAHKTRCDLQDDHPLLLSHTLSGTPADDDLVPALYSRSGGDSHPLADRLTNFRKGTAVWYLSRATGVPCPFSRAGIRLCDYVYHDQQHDPHHEISSRRDRRRHDREQICGQKRKRPLRGCVARPSESDNERPPKVKLTLRLKPLLIKVQPQSSTAEGCASTRPIEVPKQDSDSYDSSDEDSMSVDSSDDDNSQTAQINKAQEEEPWSLPPYPRRSISIPCYTPSVETYYPTYPLPPSDYRDPFRRSPSVSLSVATPPPDSEDEADDFHVTMARIKNYPEQFSHEDDTDLGWEADVDSEGDGETMWESPGPRSPSAPLIQPNDIAVKEEPRDVQGMLDAWEDFDSSIAETRVAEVFAKALDGSAEDRKVKVEVMDPWDWEASGDVHVEWTSETTRVKQEDFGVDSLFPKTLPGPSSPLSPLSALSSQFSTFSSDPSSSPPQTIEDIHDADDERKYNTVRPRAKTVPASAFFQPSFSFPPLARQSISIPSSTVREPSVPSAALVTLLQTMSVNTPTSDPVSPSSSTSSLPIPPQAPCVSPLQTRCIPSLTMAPPTPKIVVHTCQPCQPTISATQIEDISVYQMMLGAFQLLRRIDTDFVNLSPIVAYSGTAPLLSASAGTAHSSRASSCTPSLHTSGVIANATVITKGSPEICGTWVPLVAAQVYVRDHLSGEGARALEVFLSDTLVELFPSALQDFYKTNRNARGLNQFGRHFASTLVAGGLGVSDCVGVAVAGGASAGEAGHGTLKVMTALGPGVNAVVSSTPSFILGLGHSEDRDVPLSATEQELFHELCVIPPDWDNKDAPVSAPASGSNDEDVSMVVDEESSATDPIVEVKSLEVLPETPTTAKPIVRNPSPSKLSHISTCSISSISSLSSADSDSSPVVALPPLPSRAPPAAPPSEPKDGRPLRRSKRVADALAAAHVPQPSKAKSRKGGSRNSLS